jgi:hypothetical protein
LSPELFIYWRARLADAAQTSAAARRFQADLRHAHPALQAQLYQRSDSETGLLTLMETYRHPGGIPAALRRQIVEQGQALLNPWFDGPRHVEVFTPLPP